MLSVASPDGTHIFYSYDTHGRLGESHKDSNAEQVTFTYGPLGQVSQTDALGATTTDLFDYRGLIAQVEDPLHGRMFHEFDASGVLIATVDAAGQRLTYGYDESGKLASITDSLGHTVRYEYNGLRGTMSKVTDAKGNAIRFIHGYDGNLLSTIYADGLVESNAYDPVGNLIRSTDRKGQATTYTYDSAGRVLTQTFADSSTVTYVYDAHGNMKSAADSVNGTVTLSYDAHDRLIEIDYPGGKFLKYTYDAAGRRTQMTDQTLFAVNYGYDSAGRLLGLTDGSNNSIVTYFYDDAGQIKRKNNGNGTYTTYDYDLVGAPLHVTNFAPGDSVSSRFDYAYDAVGRVTSMNTLDGQWTYGYDANGQLLHAVFVSSNSAAVANQDLQYTYDAAGNRTSTILNGVTTAYTTNNLNQYTAIGAASLQYDRNGNLVERKDGGATTTYTYDVRDRLVSTSAPGDAWSYQYDALGHLASETHNGQTIQNLIDDAGLGDLVAQFDGAGALIAHFTYGDGLVSRVDTSGAKAFYNFDANANAVALTGATGAILNSYRYLPFGSVLTSSETIANPFQFDGQEGVRVSGPGLHFMRQRSYDSAAGRFTQTDPASIAGGLNLYAYGDNDPIGETDPSGLANTAKTAAAAAGLAGAKRTTAKIAQAAVELTYEEYLSLLAKRMMEAGLRLNEPETTIKVLRSMTKEEVLAVARGYLAKSELKAFDGLTRTGGKVLQSSLKAAPEAAAGAAEAGLLARAGGKLRRLGAAGLAALLEALAIQAAFGTGLQIGERWTWKRKFEDDFYDYLHKHRPGLGKFLEGAEDFFSINLFSSDPNDKIGPSGSGPGNFIAGDASLPYRIDFENDPTATAPAQVVTVSDLLSPNFDLDSFELTGIKFGDVVLTPPPGSQYFATTVQMTQDDKTFNVIVEAGLRTATREVFATFQSIDPDTQLPPELVYGFLPPEPAHVSDPVADAATPGRGRGQGQISYTIKPKAGLPTGTTITNIAKIIFDENPSIATDQVNPHNPGAGSDPAKQASVTVITGLPVSHALALTAKENDNFLVKWTGVDGISGASLEKFDVFASQDGGSFTAWQTGVKGTSALYIGALPGHTYAFYVVSTDYIGQVETKTAVAETQTTISENPWQNAENRLDVDHDSFVVASDVLAVINYINANKSGLLPAGRPSNKAYVDVTGDKNVAADDVIAIINWINAHPGQSEAPDSPPGVPDALATDQQSLTNGQTLDTADLFTLLAIDIALQPKRRHALS